MNSYHHSDLHSRITSWSQTVAPSDQPRPPRPRPPLAATSGNTQLRKRALAELNYRNTVFDRKRKKITKDKGSRTMDDEAPQARGRGRGRGLHRTLSHHRVTRQTAQALPQANITPVEAFPPSMASASPSKAPTSPFKTKSQSQPPSRHRSPIKSQSLPRRSKSVYKAKSDASIDMNYLECCFPSVRLRTPQATLEEGALPFKVQSLYESLDDTPSGFIPHVLKSYYEGQADTPRKSKQPPKKYHYLPPNSTIFPLGFSHCVKAVVDQVLRMAAWNFRVDAYERQWGGVTVAPLLNLVLLWQKTADVLLLNVENCAIEPVEMKITRPNGGALIEEPSASKGVTTESSASGSIAASNFAPSTSRMVDWSLGLVLKTEEEEIIRRAFANSYDHEQSLNQSLSYISRVPLFLDFEIKKTTTNRPPEVQLAIWAAGSLRKRYHHGWDTSIPMPGIVVKGHEWECYVLFERNAALIMMGPIRFGSTSSVNGIYEILYKLEILVRWGATDYRKWFEDTILSWCRGKSSGQESNESSGEEEE